MKHIRCIMLLLLILLMPAGVMLVDAAEGEEASSVNDAPQELDLQEISVKKSGKIKLLVYTSADKLKKSKVDAYFENEEVPIESVAPYEENASWLFLVDTSSVGTDVGREPIIDTLRILVGQMGEEEKGQILQNGDVEANISLIGKADLLSYVNGNTYNVAKYNSAANNLMETIGEALSYLANQKETDRSVLVIVSNGTTISQENPIFTEILNRIEDTDITVYTVAYVNQADDAQLADFASLALASCGGLAIQEPYDSTPANVQSSILQNEEHFYELELNPVEAGAVGEILSIKTADGSEITYDLNEKEIERITDKIKESQPEEETIGEETTEVTSELEGESSKALGLPKIEGKYLLPIGLGVVLVIIVAAILLIKRKKGNGSNQKQMKASPVSSYSKASTGSKTKTDGEGSSETDQTRIQIFLSQADGKGKIYSDYLEDGELSVGSRSFESKLVIDVDPTISSKHMVIQYENEKMYVIDTSLAGIWVDGNKIDGSAEIHQHALIRIGHMELYITWRIKK